MEIKPCDQCKKKEYCAHFQYVERRKNWHVWKLDDAIRENFVGFVITKADKNEIQLECASFVPLKDQGSYNRTLYKDNLPESQRCSNNCKKACKH